MLNEELAFKLQATEEEEEEKEERLAKEKVFSLMLKSFNMQDLEDLYNLVKAKYGSTRPVEDLDLILYGDLKTMFDPHVEDQGKIVGIKRLHDDLKVIAAKVCVTAAK
ncbi:hypothetical protein Tco_1075219 [Tanacetum coccineum]